MPLLRHSPYGRIGAFRWSGIEYGALASQATGGAIASASTRRSVPVIIRASLEARKTAGRRIWS